MLCICMLLRCHIPYKNGTHLAIEKGKSGSWKIMEFGSQISMGTLINHLKVMADISKDLFIKKQKTNKQLLFYYQVKILRTLIA